MRLRPAELRDAEILLRWRNDLLTISASHASEPVSRHDHVAWLDKVLQDPTRRLLIAEAGGVPVGTVRADLGEEGWLLSWTVAPEHRGRGHGKTVVAMAAELLAGPLLAEIKTANAASVAIAEAAGLSLVRQAYGVSYYRRA